MQRATKVQFLCPVRSWSFACARQSANLTLLADHSLVAVSRFSLVQVWIFARNFGFFADSGACVGDADATTTSISSSMSGSIAAAAVMSALLAVVSPLARRA